MGKLYAWLFRRMVRVDQDGAGPPWPVALFNVDTAAWENLGIPGSVGPTGPTGSTGPQGIQGPPGTRASGGALALSTGQSNLLDWGYVATMDGLAVLTASGEPIATEWPSVAAQPELVLTQAGEIIRC